jgi:hypothetical protein
MVMKFKKLIANHNRFSVISLRRLQFLVLFIVLSFFFVPNVLIMG